MRNPFKKRLQITVTYFKPGKAKQKKMTCLKAKDVRNLYRVHIDAWRYVEVEVK